jgi:hypothetical protein
MVGGKKLLHRPDPPGPPTRRGLLAAASSPVAQGLRLPHPAGTHFCPLCFPVGPRRSHLSPEPALAGVGTQAPFLEAARKRDAVAARLGAHQF